MGNLVTVATLNLSRDRNQGLEPSWYFENATLEGYQRSNWRFEVEEGFPHQLAIHCDETMSKVMVRRFIQRSLIGDVFYEYTDMTYSYVSSYQRDGREKKFKSSVEHGYHLFHFEEEDDRALFLVKFGGGAVEKRHPTSHRDVTEEMIKEAPDFYASW